MSRAPVAPCPSCARHVRLTEAACPFCSAPLPDAFRTQRGPESPAARLHRLARHALRMSAVSMTAAACGGSVMTSVGDHGDAADSSTLEDAKASDSSGDGSSSGGDSSSGSGEAGDDGSFVVAAYGGVIFSDAAVPTDASNGQDAGQDDAKPDHVFIAPPYGIPPMP